MCCEDICSGAVFPCRNYDRNVLFACSKNPAVFGVDFIILFEDTATKESVDHLPREEPFAFCLHIVPHLYEMVFQASECLLFGNTGVGYTVHVIFKKFVFLFGGEVTVIGNSLVV